MKCKPTAVRHPDDGVRPTEHVINTIRFFTLGPSPNS